MIQINIFIYLLFFSERINYLTENKNDIRKEMAQQVQQASVMGKESVFCARNYGPSI